MPLRSFHLHIRHLLVTTAVSNLFEDDLLEKSRRIWHERCSSKELQCEVLFTWSVLQYSSLALIVIFFPHNSNSNDAIDTSSVTENQAGNETTYRTSDNPTPITPLLLSQHPLRHVKVDEDVSNTLALYRMSLC